MKATKKLTFSAMMVAMGALFMGLGAVFQSLDMTAAALSSLLVAIVYVEVGSPYTFLVWICTTLITAVIYQGSAMWLMYLLLFGIYPILKGYIEKMPHTFWLPTKIVFGNLTMLAIFFGTTLVLGIPMDTDLFGLPKEAVYVILLAMANLAFILYDKFLTVLVRFYMIKLHPVLNKLFKF
ncbi:MAG: hypothetical protein IKV43_02490 [Clostridia bacterium]|nr:hypothetical protein [Clostridia bacterium]